MISCLFLVKLIYIYKPDNDIYKKGNGFYVSQPQCSPHAFPNPYEGTYLARMSL